MKKQFLFGMAAVAALCSCSNNEVLEAPESLKTPIAFGTYVGSTVNGRVAQANEAKLKENGFGVFGFYQKNGEADYIVGQITWTPNYMYNQAVLSNGSTSVWAYSPLKYWPNNTGDKLSFIAYSPLAESQSDTPTTIQNTRGNSNSNIKSISDNTSASDPTLTFQILNDETKQVDLLYAQVFNKAQTISNGTASVTTGEKIQFDFKHALSCIGFNVIPQVDQVTTNGNEEEDTGSATTLPDGVTKVTVSNIQLIGKFKKEATLNLAKAKPEGANYALQEDGKDPWTNRSTDTDFTFDLSGNDLTESVTTTGVTTTKVQANKDDNYIMIIPQKTTSIKVKIIYKVITTDSQLSQGNSTIENTVESKEFDFDFEQGKKYMFNLYVGLTSVKFNATISDWGDATQNVVNVPLNKADA